MDDMFIYWAELNTKTQKHKQRQSLPDVLYHVESTVNPLLLKLCLVWVPRFHFVKNSLPINDKKRKCFKLSMPGRKICLKRTG